MRKILFISALLISLVSQAQGDGSFKNLTVTTKFTFNGYYVNYIKNDTTGWSTGTRFLPTAKAVYDFVIGRVGAGGGGTFYNSNVGTGYRLAIPYTNQIKTIIAGT